MQSDLKRRNKVKIILQVLLGVCDDRCEARDNGLLSHILFSIELHVEVEGDGLFNVLFIVEVEDKSFSCAFSAT